MFSVYSADEEYRVKITDNALARDFFPGDYHCLGDNENRPVRWMAVESLEFNTYTAASVVVSVLYLSDSIIFSYYHFIYIGLNLNREFC